MKTWLFFTLLSALAAIFAVAEPPPFLFDMGANRIETINTNTYRLVFSNGRSEIWRRSVVGWVGPGRTYFETSDGNYSGSNGRYSRSLIGWNAPRGRRIYDETPTRIRAGTNTYRRTLDRYDRR